MKIPVFCAGALNVRMGYFLFIVAAARMARYAALAYLGKEYGHFTAQYLLRHGVVIGVIALALAVAVTVGLRLYQRYKMQEGEAE